MLKMEVRCSFEMSVDFQQTTQHYIPDDRSSNYGCPAGGGTQAACNCQLLWVVNMNNGCIIKQYLYLIPPTVVFHLTIEKSSVSRLRTLTGKNPKQTSVPN
jgi:hypothetical protein